MSSEPVTNELEDETLRATYTRLSVLCDAAQTLLEIAEATISDIGWMRVMHSDLSEHNHKDLSDDQWRHHNLKSLQHWSFDKELTGGLRSRNPLELAFCLILSDMRDSVEHPLVSR